MNILNKNMAANAMPMSRIQVYRLSVAALASIWLVACFSITTGVHAQGREGHGEYSHLHTTPQAQKVQACLPGDASCILHSLNFTNPWSMSDSFVAR